MYSNYYHFGQIEEDFRIGYPESHDLFKDFNCFLNSWDVFSTKLLKIRRSSIKDKYASNLLSNLDLTELNGSEHSLTCFCSNLGKINSFFTP